MCWTEVPSDLKSLGRQRARWQKGLLDVLGQTGYAVPPALRQDRLLCARPICGFLSCSPRSWRSWGSNYHSPLLAGRAEREFFLQSSYSGMPLRRYLHGRGSQEEITYNVTNDWQDVARLVSYCSSSIFPIGNCS